MTKANRLALIKLAFRARTLPAVVNASEAEVKEEISLVNHAERGELIQTEEVLPISRAMVTATEKVKINADGERETLLSREEKRRLRSEVIAYKVRQDLSRPVNPFALVLI